MSQNRLLNRLQEGHLLLGLCNMYPAAGIIEGMCKGWDWLWIDGQHGEMSYDSILHAMWAAGAVGIDTLIRVPGHEQGIIGPYIDLSPGAIMVPMVNTPEQAANIASIMRFAPEGTRSYGGRRVIDLYGRDYYREQHVMCVVQIETLEAVENVDAIAATPGVDALFFGPDDMKVQMGLPINTAVNEHERLREAMRLTGEACARHGKIAGCVAATPDSLQMVHELGYRLVVGGGDIAFLRATAAEKLGQLRRAIGDATASAGVKKGSDVYGG